MIASRIPLAVAVAVVDTIHKGDVPTLKRLLDEIRRS
jgi:hypothetical protein